LIALDSTCPDIYKENLLNQGFKILRFIGGDGSEAKQSRSLRVCCPGQDLGTMPLKMFCASLRSTNDCHIRFGSKMLLVLLLYRHENRRKKANSGINLLYLPLKSLEIMIFEALFLN
jgi:hypothetical protein